MSKSSLFLIPLVPAFILSVIFAPQRAKAAGIGDDIKLFIASTDGVYWSSSLYSINPYGAYYFYFYSSYVNPQYDSSRGGGYTVRPVSDK